MMGNQMLQLVPATALNAGGAIAKRDKHSVHTWALKAP